MTTLELAGLAAAAVILVLLVFEKFRNLSLSARLAAAENELKMLKSSPETAELRVERYELLWFPAVVFSSTQKTLEKVSAGLPHCRQCVIALKLDGQEWVCPQCRARRPESVADVMITDSVEKEATKQFLERHREYRVKNSG
ncbi:MAG: hypothetical protein HY077_10805 [Elusimicrobia bacterium]|nr:hypothetical protein [Elusimicrobiota bacterium]